MPPLDPGTRQDPPLNAPIATAGDSLAVRRIGLGRRWGVDIYHRLVRLGWPAFFAGFAGVFLAINVVFALAYLADPGGLDGDPAMFATSPFLRAFFFSVHTIATVGYGNITPRDLFANAVVVVEIGCGILVIAVTSGLMFARFSRPTARVLFSDIAVIRPFEGVPSLMFRAANQRDNFILEASVRVSLLRLEADGEGTLRRFYDLALVRDRSPMFALSWLVMHKIEPGSPLWREDGGVNFGGEDQLIVILSGLDSTMAQTVHARHGYLGGHVRHNHGFVDVVGADDDGNRTIDYRRFHLTEPLD